MPGPPRPWDFNWACDLITAAREFDHLYTFVKQTGAWPAGLIAPADGAGANPEHWPIEIRVQDFPPELLK